MQGAFPISKTNAMKENPGQLHKNMEAVWETFLSTRWQNNIMFCHHVIKHDECMFYN